MLSIRKNLFIIPCLLLFCLSLDFYKISMVKSNLYSVSSQINKDALNKHYLDFPFIEALCNSESIEFRLISLEDDAICTYQLAQESQCLTYWCNKRAIIIQTTIWIQYL